MGKRIPVRFHVLPEFVGKELLSERELEVLYHLLHIRHSKRIARELKITDRTVHGHTLNIYKKLIPEYQFEQKKIVHLIRLVYSLDELDRLIELGHQARRHRRYPKMSHINVDYSTS